MGVRRRNPAAPLARTLDLRTHAARLMDRTRAELTAHVGGRPSATQRALIERCAVLTMHTAKLDAKAIEHGSMTEVDSRTYLAFSNSLARSLRLLGLEARAAERATESLADIAAEIEAAAAAAEAAAKPTAEPSASIEREAA